jgi:hypothetical protein
MAERTNFSGYPIASGYVQQLITANTNLATITGADTTTVVYAANNSPSALEVGTSSVAITDGSVNFNIKSHDGTNGLKLAGNLVRSSADELNILDGVTSTAAELNYLDITTLGTSQVSKAVTVNSSGDLIVPDSDKFKFGAGSDMQLYHDGSNSYITNAVGILKLATETNGIAVTIGHTTSEVTIGDNLTITGTLTLGSGAELTEAELEMLDGITAGTALASKALVVDSNKDIGTIRNLTIDGVLTDGNYTFDTSGNVSGLGTVASGAITSSGIIKTDSTTDATSTTDGSLQTDGGLSVAKDCIFGDDVKLLSDSAVLNLGAGNDVTLTHDGTTGGTLAGNPLILDSGGDIEFNADGGDITFKDASTTAMSIDMDTTSGAAFFLNGAGNMVFGIDDGDRNLYFYDKGGEYISSDGTDLTIAAGTSVNIIAELEVLDGKVSLADTQVIHGITNVAPTNVYGDFGPIHGTQGGLYINGISDQESAAARSLALRGICNDTHTDTVPTVEIIGAKRSGTTVQALASAETVLQVANHTTTLMTVLGSGNVGINDTAPDNQLHVTNTSGVTTEVVKLEQLDDDEPFILFTGTTASDQTKSLSTDTSVGALTGHILVSINGTDRWIPFYAKN